jgi:hypothetical protein
MGNVLYSYIMPYPFDSEYKDNYLSEELWPYLVGLYEAPSTLKYVGFNPHGQQQISEWNSHRKALKVFGWSIPPIR